MPYSLCESIIYCVSSCKQKQHWKMSSSRPLRDNTHSKSPLFFYSSLAPVSRVNGYPWLCNIKIRKTLMNKGTTTINKAVFLWLHCENDSKHSLTITEICYCIAFVSCRSRMHQVWGEAKAALPTWAREPRHLEQGLTKSWKSCMPYSSIAGSLKFYLYRSLTW